MNNRKFPRTLQEAFGPYTSREFTEPMEPMSLTHKAAIVITLLAAAFFTAKVVLS
jgi:hypothetical protein